MSAAEILSADQFVYLVGSPAVSTEMSNDLAGKIIHKIIH